MATVGRPKTNAFGSASAGTRLADSLHRNQLSQAELSRRLMVSTRTVGRWLKGSDGPDPESARRLAEELGEPQLSSWWNWPKDDAGGTLVAHRSAPVSTTADRPVERGPLRRRLTRRVLIVAAVAHVVVVAIVVALLLIRPWQPSAGEGSPGQSAAVVHQGEIDGRMSGGRAGAREIRVWSRPSTTTGCDISPCLPGTGEAGSLVLPASVEVICVVKGQQIRNGAPGEPGFYRDDRWLRIAATSAVHNPGGPDLFLSNIWFERDRLPSDLPTCAGQN